MNGSAKSKNGSAGKGWRFKEEERKNARIEVSAGGIVYRRTPKGVRIALILDPYRKWAFPKGHVEKGESVRAAAVRETMEETGIAGVRIVAPLGSIDLWFRDRYRPETQGELIHKYVRYFLMEAPSGAFGRPQRNEKIRRIIWVSPRTALTRSGYKSSRPLLAKAVRMLERLT